MKSYSGGSQQSFLLLHAASCWPVLSRKTNENATGANVLSPFVFHKFFVLLHLVFVVLCWYGRMRFECGCVEKDYITRTIRSENEVSGADYE